MRDAVRDIKLKGTGAALIACATDRLLDAIAQIETDFDLPRGVESRRSDMINASAYWSSHVNPTNVDEHIAYAQKGGFRLMLLYYRRSSRRSRVRAQRQLRLPAEYPNGQADLMQMLDKIKAPASSPPAFPAYAHRPQEPLCHAQGGPRLNLTRRFTLAQPLSPDDTRVYVEQNPEGTVMATAAACSNSAAS